MALANGPKEEAEFDRLPCFDGADVCESAVCESDTVPLGTVVAEDVCEAKEPRSFGRDVLLKAPDIEYKPVFGPPVLTTTPGAGWELVSVDVDTGRDGEVDGPVSGSACLDDVDDVDVEADVDGAPSVDVDELVDVELEPDGSADATP